MIRFRRLTPALLDAWLVDQRLANTHQRYRLRVWRENRAGLAAIANVPDYSELWEEESATMELAENS